MDPISMVKDWTQFCIALQYKYLQSFVFNKNSDISEQHIKIFAIDSYNAHENQYKDKNYYFIIIDVLF